MPPPLAVIVAGVDPVTLLVAIVNVAVAAPCATVTLGGTVAAPLLLERDTDMPPAGAAPLKVTVPCDEAPPVTIVGFTDTAETVGADAVASGRTVSVAVCVTPPPLTEIVTLVCAATCDVKTLKPPAVVPAGMVTPLLTLATAGLLLVRLSVVSVDCAAASVTRPKELPPVPTVDVGVSVSPDGAGCGVSVTRPMLVAPFHDAVTDAVVFTLTPLVASGNDTENCPGFTDTDAGGFTAGESLVNITVAPPGGACPLSITIAVGVAPPLIVPGEMVSDFSADSPTVSCPLADAPLSVAVIVAGVGEATWPACIWNWVQAMFAGIVIDAGTGAAPGFELARLIVVATGGALVSCTCTHVVDPLVTGLLVNDTDAGVGGAELTVNVPVADHGVTAAVVGEESPCTECTRQNFCPGVSDSTVRDGLLS